LEKKAKKILFGLFKSVSNPDETIVCSVPQLNWLVSNPFSMAGQWKNPDGTFQSSVGKTKEGEKVLDRKIRLDERIDKYIAGLSVKGFISYGETDFLYRINVKEEGFKTGTMLESLKGRAAIWLKENIIIFICLGIIGALVLAGILYSAYLK
jgi:hypothetical protein